MNFIQKYDGVYVVSLVKLNCSTDKRVASYGECQLLSYTSKSEPGTIHVKHEFMNEADFRKDKTSIPNN